MAAGGRDPLFRKMFLGVVRRFSVLATVCVALIVASGALIAYLQFGAPTRWPARTDDIFGGLMTVLERSLAPLLATLTAPGGLIALSGILAPQADEVREAYAPWFDMHSTDPDEEWVVLAGRKK